MPILQAQIDDLMALLSKTIFVSSTEQTGNLGGVAGADSLCNDFAIAAGLPGVYKAWLASNDDDDPESRFVQSAFPYILPDGVVVADDWADLTDGSLQNPINVDENVVGGVLGAVWTNVDPDGHHSAQPDCANWTDDGITNIIGAVGLAQEVDARWTDFVVNPICNTGGRLYCFMQ